MACDVLCPPGMSEKPPHSSRAVKDASRTLYETSDERPDLGFPNVSDKPFLPLELPVADGRYAVSGEQARGGLGRILQAHDLRLDRTVAVKEPLYGGLEVEARFIREALITARLQHPAIVPVHDLGRSEGGKPFYVMKMVAGRSLAEVLRERRSLAERLALLPSLIAVADAMAYAHAHGIVHRDLKPSNVLIGPFGETVIVDWGLAADLNPTRSAGAVSSAYQIATSELTTAGTVMGTPEYMPPEQAQGKSVDERADVYAIGAMLYQLLSGAPPYEGATSREVLESLTKVDPIPIRQRHSAAPKELAAIVTKAMARDRNKRYPTARELRDDLRSFETHQVLGHGYRR